MQTGPSYSDNAKGSRPRALSLDGVIVRVGRGNFRCWRLACLALVVIALAVFALHFPITEWLLQLSQWLRGQRAGGAVVLCAVEIAWIVLCLPSTPLELLIGSTYGFAAGFVVDTVGKSLGCMGAFALGRHIGRGPVASWLAKTQGGRAVQLLRALDVAIATQGWRIVLPFQAAWLPIALKNYGLSLCNLPARTFAWTMLVAELPMTALVVYAGSTARSLADLLEHREEAGSGAVVGLVVGAAMLVVTLVVVMRYVAQALRQLEQGEAAALPGHLHAYNRVAAAQAATGGSAWASDGLEEESDYDVGLALTDYDESDEIV
jgi:uncharacterized membrane protein YdjX (TVP38/TMEM64 family)